MTTSRPRGETRQRILDTALRRFAEHGYAGTSVRDLAEELGLTKAAVHYHFAAKGQIVQALLEPMIEQFDGGLARLEQEPAEPRAVLLEVRDVLAAYGPVLQVCATDPSVAEPGAALHVRLQALAARTAGVRAGPGASPTRLLRAHCALGAFFAGWEMASGGVAGAAPAPVGDDALEALLLAALGALGPVGA